MIDVELNQMFSEIAGAKLAKLDVGGTINLKQLAARFGIKEDDVGMLFINKKWALLDSVIFDGDFVQLYPFMEGG